MGFRVKVLIVGTVDDGGVDNAAAWTASYAQAVLKQVNKWYAPAQVEFVLDATPLETSTDLAQDGGNHEQARDAYARRHPEHLVIFIRHRGGGGGYSSPDYQYAVMPGPGGDRASLLAHELGHFFGLQHTHPDDDKLGPHKLADVAPGIRKDHLENALRELKLTEEQAPDRFRGAANVDAGWTAVHDVDPDPGPPLFQPKNGKENEECSDPAEVELNWEGPSGTQCSIVLRPDKDNLMSYFKHCKLKTPDDMHFSPGQAKAITQIVEWGVRRRLTGGWHLWGSRGEGRLKESPAVLCRRPQQLELFARGMDDRMWQASSVPGSGWTDWFSHGDGQVLGAGPTVGSMGPEQVSLFALDGAGAPIHKVWVDDTGRWSTWSVVGSALLKESPAVLCRQPGLLELFGRGLDDRTYQNSFTDGDWTGWFAHDDGQALGGGPTVASLGSDQVNLFAIDAAGAPIYKWWIDSAGEWSAWSAVGSALLKESPAVLSQRGPGLLELFGRGLDDHIYQDSYAGGAWTGWFAHNDGQALGAGPTVGSTAADRVQVFSIGPDRKALVKEWIQVK